MGPAGSVVALDLLMSSGSMGSVTLLPRWLLGLCLSIVGVVLGNRLASRIPAIVIKRPMVALLCVSSMSLLQQFWARVAGPHGHRRLRLS